MEMMLQTQNLCKYFKKQKAVNNVSLNIEKGQIDIREKSREDNSCKSAFSF